MRADDEHQQRESDVGEEQERGIGGVDRARARSAKRDAGRDLADDNRWRDLAGEEGEQRSEEADRNNERERAEVQNTPASSPAANVMPNS